MIPMLYNTFKHWSEKGSVYIFSDPHFDDSDCKLMDKNWITPQEHIDIINKTVKRSDTLICLGDCGNLEWFDKIKAGYKILIKGNHDDKNKSLYQKIKDVACWDEPFFTREEIKEKLSKLGYKNIVVTMNYEPNSFIYNKSYAEKGIFDEVYDGPLFIAPKILLSHEPIIGLNFAINIHGHDHGGVKRLDDFHINLASNVYNYQVFNLKDEIKNGLVSKINDIHRITINKAEEKKNGIN